MTNSNATTLNIKKAQTSPVYTRTNSVGEKYTVQNMYLHNIKDSNPLNHGSHPAPYGASETSQVTVSIQEVMDMVARLEGQQELSIDDNDLDEFELDLALNSFYSE